jgi:thiol-disulfide isomerase/thioredoxin
MRTLLLTLLAVAGCRGPAAPPTEPDAPAPRVGKVAPPLPPLQWLHGEPVTAFEPGTVYVLDFWATWCGPCLQTLPHLQQVAAAYADRGVVVVGVTTLTDRNPMGNVRAVLAAFRSDRHPVRQATTDTPEVEETYRVSSLPRTVVVGPDGRVAYVGHPLRLEDVLDRLLAGTWAGRASAAEVESRVDELDGLYQRAARAPAAGLADLAKFEAAHPDVAGRTTHRVAKVSLLVGAGRHADAKALTEELLPVLKRRTDTASLAALREVWADRKGNPARKHPELAVAAAEAIADLDGATDPRAAAGLADSLAFAGDKQRAKAVLDAAIAVASPEAKTMLVERRKAVE